MNYTWKYLLKEELKKDYYIQLKEFVNNAYSTTVVYPKKEDVFNTFNIPTYNIRVVIISQDPYHQPHQANGYAFAVNEDVPIPPSLYNIFTEIKQEFGILPKDKTLKSWTNQGVFLLNTILTVEYNKPLSHANIGWEIFTNRVIELLNESTTPKVFMLWGSNARAKKSLITSNKHLILEAPHPSPLSAYRGFFGCDHFKKANEWLKQNGYGEIDWTSNVQ